MNGLYQICSLRNIQTNFIKKDGSFIKFNIINGKYTYDFIDSLKFIQAPLSSFPKDFGLGETAKLDFPYLLNTTENYCENVVLKEFPAIE